MPRVVGAPVTRQIKAKDLFKMSAAPTRASHGLVF